MSLTSDPGVRALPDGRFRAFYRGCLGTFETFEEACARVQARRAPRLPRDAGARPAATDARKKRKMSEPAQGVADTVASWDEFRKLSNEYVARSKELAEIRARMDVVATVLRVDS